MKLKIFKIVDELGWANYFTTIEQKRYSRHEINYLNWKDTLIYFDKLDYDIIQFNSPTMNVQRVIELINKAKDKNKKVVTAYTGLCKTKYHYSDLQLPISILDIETLKKETRFPTVFLPESVDTNFYIPKINLNPFILGWAGRKAEDKRCHLLNRLIFPVTIKSDYGKQFFIERIPEDMLNFYNNIKCLVLVSSHECMPRVILEAMACGLPVIATNVGNIPLMLDKNWIISVFPESKTIEEINMKLKSLYNNKELLIEVGNKNREWCEKRLSWKTNISLWDDCFEALYNNDYNTIEQLSNNYLNKEIK